MNNENPTGVPKYQEYPISECMKENKTAQVRPTCDKCRHLDSRYYCNDCRNSVAPQVVAGEKSETIELQICPSCNGQINPGRDNIWCPICEGEGFIAKDYPNRVTPPMQETAHQFDDLKIDLKWDFDVSREEIEKEVLSCLDEMEKYRKGQPHGLAVISVSIKEPDRGITIVNAQETSKELPSVQPIAWKSLEECKNEVALKNGLICWRHLQDQIPIGAHEKYHNEAAALYATQRQPEWISYNADNRPLNGSHVLAWNGKAIRRCQSVSRDTHNMFERWIDVESGDRCLTYFYDDITHYQYLPNPPKER